MRRMRDEGDVDEDVDENVRKRRSSLTSSIHHLSFVSVTME